MQPRVPPATAPLGPSQRRQAITLSYVNAAIWAVGNGLVPTILVIYLALDRGANNTAISLILAAPRFAGILRLASPALLAWLRRRKAFCIAAYLASSVFVLAVPVVAAPNLTFGFLDGMAGLVVVWCLYHLLEYLGTIALWSWLGDLVPGSIRGRFCGSRERWLVAGRIVGIVASVSLAWCWRRIDPGAPRWEPLACSAAIGAGLLAAAVLPLLSMPAIEFMPSARPRTPWRAVMRATIQRPYRQLVAFSCILSVAHGITLSAQSAYPRRILGISYPMIQALTGMMRGGQTLVAPALGRRCDCWGNRPVMLLSLLVAGTGPLFFLAATPDQWWWLAGAYLVWIAYAGVNVGIDAMKLALAPRDNNVPYLAVYYAISDGVFGVTTVGVGLLMDALLGAGYESMSVYLGVFVVGYLARVLALPVLMRIDEPGALRARELLTPHARSAALGDP
jgi:hypothetical protein